MLRKRILLMLITGVLFSVFTQAQDDLMNMFDESDTSAEEVTASFKAGRIVLGQSIENPKPGNLNFVIQHQFGRLNSGSYELFGLDQATIRLGFEYGINDWLGIGIGRSSLNKTFDGYIKTRILKQKTGKSMPVSVSYFGGIFLISLKWEEPERKNYFSSRLSFAHQILIARKINKYLTLQLTPTLIHRNLVETNSEENDVFALGLGGRYKLSNRVSVNAGYYYLLPGNTADHYDNSLSVGFDIETGGHVFQLFLSNSLGMQEPYFIANTSGSWSKGDIHFGFSINRTFVIRKPEGFR